MKFKHLLIALIAAVPVLFGCEQEEDLGSPRLTVDVEQLSFDQGEGSNTLQITATRDWFISSKPEWVALSAEEGKGSAQPQTVTVSVNANSGNDRTGEVLFSIGYVKRAVVVNQKGAQGELKKGSGTLEDPYTVAGVIEYVQGLGKDIQSPGQVYIKGVVESVETTYEASGTYGNATFFLVDEGMSEPRFYCFQTLYLGNKKWSSGQPDIAKGDQVIVHGYVVNYKGNTPETVSKGNSYVYSLNGKSDDTPAQTEITACTIAEFIQKADPNTYYRLTGKVSSFGTGTAKDGRKWLQFNLNDGTASILVYGFKDGQYDKWAEVIKDGGTAVLTGTYEYYEKNQQHEVMNATVESFEQGGPAKTVTGTVSQTIAANDGDNVVIESCQVMAKSNQGIVVSDATGDVYLYFDAKQNETVPAVNIGDMVKVEASKDTYGGVPEFKSAKVTVVSAGGQVVYPEPKNITPIATVYESKVTEFIQMSGKLTISGNYYNVELDGVDSAAKMGSISAPLESLGAASYDGKKVTVKGYFSGLTGSGGKYINIVAVNIGPADPNAKYCSVSTSKINVKADATSASFQISTNADWTVESDNQAFTVSPASGTGDADVTVSFSANETDAPRVANIKVSCPSANYEATVVVTQAKPASGNAVVITADFTIEDKDNLPQGSSAGKQDGTYTVDGYTFTFHAADKYYQAKSSGAFYLLIGKQDSYVEFPVVEGKSLVKVEFLTGAAASEKVIGDLAKADGTRLNVNNDKLKQGTSYTWELTGEIGAAYRFVVTNSYNAQFQTLTLTYE